MNNSLFGESGIQLTLVLVLIPVIAALVIAVVRTYAAYKNIRRRREYLEFQKKISTLTPEEIQEYEQKSVAQN